MRRMGRSAATAAKRTHMTRGQRADHATAYHEAGHAVAAYFLRRVGKVRCVSIIPDSERETVGHTAHWSTPAFWRALNRGEWPDHARCRFEDEVVVLLAGGSAERRFAGRADHIGARSDYEKAADFAIAATGSKRAANAFLRWLQVTTEDLVTLRWPAIQAVAAALVEHKRLSGACVRKVIFDGSGNAPPRNE